MAKTKTSTFGAVKTARGTWIAVRDRGALGWDSIVVRGGRILCARNSDWSEALDIASEFASAAQAEGAAARYTADEAQG